MQRAVCTLLAGARRHRGDSYVAGGVALNELLGGSRRSHDVDLFHDTELALGASWDADRALLESSGFVVRVVRERPAFVQARVRRGEDEALLEWAQDSAYRFFPLIEHDTFGLALHPFDLATNKLLALVGRREPRDWIDVLRCHEVLQPIGYLAWAAAGKDPGFGPLAILAESQRSARYTEDDLRGLDFESAPPVAADLSRAWHLAMHDAELLVALLPAEHAGTCVLDQAGKLLTLEPRALGAALADGAVSYHPGRIQGAWPVLR